MKISPPAGMTDHASRIQSIGALRGLAALSVAWFHFTQGGGLLQDGWLKASGAHGWLGVEVFFVISGFIIPFALYRTGYRFPSHAGRFLLKRAIRVDPPYLAAILLALALWYLSSLAPGFEGPAPAVDPIQLLLHLGYLNAFFGYPWAIVVLWSLAIEFQFYLLISAAFPLVAHSSARIRLCSLTALCGSAFLIPDGTLVFHYLGLFVLGIATFTKYVGLTSLRAYLLTLPPLFAVAAATTGIAAAAAGLLTALTIAFVRLPRYAPLAFLGAISYSIYLVHVPVGGRVINVGARFASDAASQVAVLASAFAVTIAAAYFMYRFIERPAVKWSSALKYDPRGMDRPALQPTTENR